MQQATTKLLLFVIGAAVLYRDVVGVGTGEVSMEVSGEVPMEVSGEEVVDKPLGEKLVDIYKYTVNILMGRMRSWVNGAEKNLTEIERYIGLPDRTVHLIDTAMTEMTHQQRMMRRLGIREWEISSFRIPDWNENERKEYGRRLDKLLDAYYFSCDVKHAARVGGPENVAEKFEGFLHEHGSEIVENTTEDQLVAALTESLAGLYYRAEFEFRVTVGLMKNIPWFEPLPRGGNMAKMASSIVVDGMTTVPQLAREYSESATGTEVIRNHLTVLRDLVPRMFRYAYDHVSLTLEYLFEFGPAEKPIYLSCFNFVERFLSLFVVRYFEFLDKDPVPKKLFEHLELMGEFCSPRSMVPGVHKLPNIKNFKTYQDMVEKDATTRYANYVRMTVKESLEALVQSFGFDKSLENSMKNKTYTCTTKEVCLQAIKENMCEGMDVMDEYYTYFENPSENP